MPEDLSTRLQAIDFSHDIEHLTRDFTGRKSLFTIIDRWLKEGQERFCLLTGEPGTGKSAVAARLTQVRQRHVLAHHFCIAGRNSTIVPAAIGY